MRKNTKHFKAESKGDLLFVMIIMPNSTQHSNVMLISANDVSFAIGKSAIMPV